MKISPINNNNVCCKGFFGKSVIKKTQIGNYKIIDAARKYFPLADETMADLAKVTENNDIYHVATYNRGPEYKFYSTVKIGETIPCTAEEYKSYKAANLANGMSKKESAIHEFLIKHGLNSEINETAADIHIN